MSISSPKPYRSRAVIAIAAILSVGLSACSTIPQSAPFAAEPSQAKKVNPIDNLNKQVWWKGMGDAQLQTLLAQASENSPTLAEAEARLNQAEASLSQYRAANRPSVDLNVKPTETKQSYKYLFPEEAVPKGYKDYGLATLNLNWDLDFWGRNRAAVSAATTQAQAAQAEVAQARLVLTTAIAANYIDLDRLYKERDLAARAVEIRSDSAHLVAQKLANGVTNKGEDAQARASVLSSQADVAALDEQIALNKHMIATLIGAAPDFADKIERPNLTAEAFGPAPKTVSLDLIGRRPDIIAARWRAESASARIRQAHAAFYPNINIAGFIGFQSIGVGNLFTKGADMGEIGPALSLPIFDGGALKANLKSAESGHALAIASYNEDVLTAMQQVADTLTSQRALNDRLNASEQALSAYEDAYQVSKLRYDGGLTDYTTLLVAEQGLIGQRRVVADLHSRALTLNVALIKALGGQNTSTN
ncbi:MAG: efflux transporter outer membrane subunit [Asticcacaulis sp.]